MKTAGVRKIVRFNWPWYAAALAVNVVVLFATRALSGPWTTAAWIALVVADAWLLGSLLVSQYVYDRSGLAHGAWLDVLASTPRDIAVLHAGQDEATAVLSRRFPDARIAPFDFFDPGRTAEGSLLRARAASKSAGATPLTWNAFDLDDASFDLVCVVFAAHELREPAALATFFGEVRRVLRPRSAVIVVEHLRDGWNGLVYGPGAFHFLPLHWWKGAFREAGLRLRDERKHTPFVSGFLLDRAS